MSKAKAETKSRKWQVDIKAEPFAMTDEVVKDSLTRELDVIKWINEADSPKERQFRKAAMHGILYSGTAPKEGSLSLIAQRIRDSTAEAQAASTTNPKTLMGEQKVPILSVIPPASIIAQATAMRYGAFLAKKVDGTRGYGPYNWRDQSIEAHIYIDAAIRHLMQWFDGDNQEIIRDDEGRALDCVSHLAFALATIGILLDAEANDTLIDDRPKVRKMAATTLLNNHKLTKYDK